MTISFKRYVDIVSGVGGGAIVSRRTFMGRLFTTNPLLPTNSFIEFESAADVGTFFGTSSVEYLRASVYFSWISKNITRAKKISFARWAEADVAPRIYGIAKTHFLTNWTSISAGTFDLTIGATTNTIGPLDFTAAASLADVASIIETEIQTNTGTQWTAATVTFDAIRGSFDFLGGATGAAVISAADSISGTQIRTLLGWTSAATFSDGVVAETVTDVLTASAAASNNFGSFLFIPALNLSQVEEASAWASLQNVTYMYFHGVLKTDASTYYDAIKNYGGVGLTASEISIEYPEQLPMQIFAATNYDAINSTQNYMFQMDNLTPSVTTDTEASTLDALRTNYYGITQNAGQYIAFYQRGLLMGPATSPQDMNTFANEIWFKDAVGVSIMNLLLALAKVSANDHGRAQLRVTVQSVVDEALDNGTISPGKPLSTTQKLYIAEITGDQNAWLAVQNIGYWLDCSINAETNTATYTFVYSKDDVIRKVEGTHVLI